MYARINGAGFVWFGFLFFRTAVVRLLQRGSGIQVESWRRSLPSPEGKLWGWAGRRWESGEELRGGRGRGEVTFSALKLLMVLWYPTPGYCLVHFIPHVPVDFGLTKLSQSMQGAGRGQGSQDSQHDSEERPQRLSALLLV